MKSKLVHSAVLQSKNMIQHLFFHMSLLPKLRWRRPACTSLLVSDQEILVQPAQMICYPFVFRRIRLGSTPQCTCGSEVMAQMQKLANLDVSSQWALYNPSCFYKPTSLVMLVRIRLSEELASFVDTHHWRTCFSELRNWSPITFQAATLKSQQHDSGLNYSFWITHL